MLGFIGSAFLQIIFESHNGIESRLFHRKTQENMLSQSAGIGTIGMLLNFAVTLGLTPFFPKPGEKIQDMIDSVREPEGAGPAVEIEDAPEH